MHRPLAPIRLIAASDTMVSKIQRAFRFLDRPAGHSIQLASIFTFGISLKLLQPLAVSLPSLIRIMAYADGGL